MNRPTKLLFAVASMLPLLATAQSSPTVTPAGQPRSDLEKQQTVQNGNAQKHGSATDGAALTTSSGDPAADAGEKGKTKRKTKSANSAPGATPASTTAPDGATPK